MDLIIDGLHKSFKKINALDNINLHITPGVHGLLGANGAGKSTLLRILATVLSPDSGTVLLGDIKLGNSKAYKSMIGYLPQQFGIYKYLTVLEALQTAAALKELPHNTEKQEIDNVIEAVNLSNVAKTRTGHLSGGMLRRLGLAQALLGNPKVLLLDEPSVGLDPLERINMRNIIRHYGAKDNIVIMSSHIVDDLDSICDHISILHNGKLLANGSVQDIRALSKGYVIEEIVTESVFEQLSRTGSIVSFTPIENNYQVRYIADQAANNSTAPTLEDSYVQLIMAQGAQNESFPRA